MTVGELMAGLQALIDNGSALPETVVITEGCDCWGQAHHLEIGPNEEAGTREQTVRVCRSERV